MKHLKPILLALVLTASFATTPATSQKEMVGIVFSVNFDLDATVRCLGSGTTVVPTVPKEGRTIVISLDNTTGSETALIQQTDPTGDIPATIDTSTAHWSLIAGQELVLNQTAGDTAKPDARQFYAVGTGKIRVKCWDVTTNFQPQ